jgi:protein-S-isoprenylcysteine O-methyltransferase Ste14
MPKKLLLIPWFAGILYSSIPLFWFAIHPLTPVWRKMRRSPYLVLLPLWAAIIAVMGAVSWPWHSWQIYSAWWAWVAALPLFWIGLRTYRNIRSAFGLERFTGQAELRPEEVQQTLVVGGMHASMRHPIYFAHLCMLAAWTLGSGLAVNYLLLGISILATFPLMIWLEERELVKRFGAGYLEYQKSVPLAPRLMSHSYRDRINRNRAHAGTAQPVRKP